VVGATGHLGSNIVEELIKKKAFNLKLLIRKETFEAKKELIQKFREAGATLTEGRSLISN